MFRPRSPHFPSLSPAAPGVVVTTAVVATLAWALLCNAVLEALQRDRPLDLLTGAGPGSGWGVFLAGAAVVWFLMLLLLALTGRLWLTLGTTLSLATLVGMVNREKLRIRLEPIYPTEWSYVTELGFLTQMVSVSRLLGAGAVLVGIVAVAVLVGRLVARWFPRPSRRRHPLAVDRILGARAAVMIVCGALLVTAAGFNRPGNPVRGAFDQAGAVWMPWSQKSNYLSNGFVGGFLYNLSVPAMDRPADYSEETMARIAAKYAAVAERTNRSRRTNALAGVNVVTVLSESFSDPLRVPGVTLAEDPIPYTRRLMERTTSGQILSQWFGGGTANMEFEVLTGMAVSTFAPQLKTPYQMILPFRDDFPSVVGMLAQRGHRPVAIHPYLASMYQRETAYPVLGFDEFVAKPTMTHRRRVASSPFISDYAAYAEVLDHLRAEHQPMLVNVVTMQNHFPFRFGFDRPIGVSGLTEEENELLGQYSRGLWHSDRALKRFLRSLGQQEEKTVVVLYGDHLPSLYDDSTVGRMPVRIAREAPFLVWANFGSNESRPMPTTSPIHLMPLVFERAGAVIPAWYALLEELRAELPAMGHELLIGPDDEVLQEGELSDRTRELLHDYRLVQYDLAVGERYSQESMFYPRDVLRATD